MKVLHVNYTDKGGAFIALKRIDESLRMNFSNEYSSSFLIVNPAGSSGLNYVTPIKSTLDKLISFLRPRIVRVVTSLIFKSDSNATESYNILRSRKVIKFINNSDYDLVHFHWIGGETISIKDFNRIKKPIVWTLHDSWSYLGRHHFQIFNNDEITNKGIDNYLKKIKRKSWKNLGMEIICVSDWLKTEVDNSEIFIGNNVIRIHNSINTDYWQPIEVELARKLLNLSNEKMYLTLGAVNPTSDIRKGFSLLAEAIKLIPDEMKSNVEILMFGTRGDDVMLSGIKAKFMGEISDELVLKILFAASDVILVPSYYESFGQTALEGISMEKPVVCFDSSGTVDLIKHLENGYIAKSFCVDDFAKGIIWAINNSKSLEVKLSSRQFAINKFDYKEIAAQYYEVYNKQLNQFKNL
jgi:glycosyltransferase involved in cell wall biosynthesis